MGAKSNDRPASETAHPLIVLNDKILEAEEAGRREDLEPLLTDDFTIIRANGAKQDRQQFLDAVAGNAGRGRTVEQPEVRTYGDSAVYTCIVTTTRNPDGTPGGGRFRNTRHFVLRNENWRCASWQVTRISEV